MDTDKKLESVRVRFAPSPTGHLHLGGLRTAIFNWLFARHHAGKFLVRIEDTDRERSSPEYEHSIMTSLDWIDVLPDEPVMIQTSRDAEHKKLIEQLLAEGKAYRCYCTTEVIVARCGYNEHQKYDGFCQNRTDTPDLPYAVRFAVPREQKTITFHDLIRGDVTFDIDQFDDFIIARSNGAPTYNFVVVADDVYMKISHVIRGEDHIPNTPKQIMIYHALGDTPPLFVHIPLILGAAGNRLSKRDAATSVLEYKQSGFLPDAFFNYLVRLGWAHGDQELFTREELINYFTLNAVGKKGSIFDQTKLEWVNATYLKNMAAPAILDYITQVLDPEFRASLVAWSNETVYALIDLYKGRAKRVTDIIDGLHALYNMPTDYNSEAIATWCTKEHLEALAKFIPQLQESSFVRDELAHLCKDFCKEHELKLSALAQPIRIALTGSTTSPGVFDLLAILGKEESVTRIQRLLQRMA